MSQERRLQLSKLLTYVHKCYALLLAAGIVWTCFGIHTLIVYVKHINTAQQNRVAEEQVYSDIALAEAGQRGYIMTDGSLKGLEEYNRGIGSVDFHLRVLNEFLYNDPGEKDRLRRLNDAVNAKLAEMSKVIKVYRSQGREAAESQIMQGSGVKEMEAIEEAIDAIRASENERIRIAAGTL